MGHNVHSMNGMILSLAIIALCIRTSAIGERNLCGLMLLPFSVIHLQSLLLSTASLASWSDYNLPEAPP
jgi:hypothetical protein